MIIDGKKIAQNLEEKLRRHFQGTSGQNGNLSPKKVAFILFGENFVSQKFMTMKESVAKRLGVEATIIEKPLVENGVALTTDSAIAFIESIATGFDGMVVQLPLPEGLDADRITNAIPLSKDIDLLSTAAMDAYKSSESDLLPPVARAVFEILKYHDVDLLGKKILIVGNGKLVGAPVVAMLERELASGAVFSFAQIRRSTPENERNEAFKHADIIISGVGEPHFITPDMVKDGAILIDAGTSEQAGKLAGDIDPRCAEKASLFTPVPGGVGPVTVVSLFSNLL